MHHYKLGYWTDDGAAAVELYHTDAIDAAAFELMVYAGTAAVLKSERRPGPHFPFAWLYDEVAQWLVMTHGFNRVRYEVEFEIFGSRSVLDIEPDMPDVAKMAKYLRLQGLAPGE